jgi:hypothetical protein
MENIEREAKLANFREYVAKTRAKKELPPMSEETIEECFDIIEQFHASMGAQHGQR